MPQQKDDSPQKGFDVNDINPVQLAQVTRLLYMAKRCTTKEDYEQWLALQSTQIASLDKALLYEKPKGFINLLTAKLQEKELLWFSDKTQLCKTHKALHPGLIHSLTLLIAKEITVYVDRYRYLRRKDQMPDWMTHWLDRIDTISMLWMGQEPWEEAFDTTLPPGTDPHYAVSIDCDACKLACIGGDITALKDIRTNLVARTIYFRERHNNPTWDGPFLLRMTEAWFDTCYKKHDRADIHFKSSFMVPFLVDLRRELKVRLEEEKAQGKSQRRYRRHVPKVTASGIPLPRPKYTDEETKNAKAKVMCRGVYRAQHVNNSERDDSEPDNADTLDELYALEQPQVPGNTQVNNLGVLKFADEKPAGIYNASSVYSEPPVYVRPPVAPITTVHPAFADDESQHAGNHERFSYELPRVAPLWDYMKNRDMRSTDPNAVAPASSPTMESWEEDYYHFVVKGGSGDDYYEQGVVAGPSNTYDADDERDREPQGAGKQGPLFTHGNESYTPIRHSWIPEQPYFNLETPTTPIRESCIPEPLSTGSSSNNSASTSNPANSSNSSAPAPYSGGSSNRHGPVPSPGGRLLHERSFLESTPEDHEPLSAAELQRSKRRAPTPYHHQADTQEFTASQLRKGKYRAVSHSSTASPVTQRPAPRQVNQSTLAQLEGQSGQPIMRSNARRVRKVDSQSNRGAGVQSQQGIVEDVAEDMGHLSAQKGVRKEKSEESVASCYPEIGWGGPRRR